MWNWCVQKELKVVDDDWPYYSKVADCYRKYHWGNSTVGG